MSALDRFGGDPVAEPLARYRALHDELRVTERELDDVTTHARDRAREADLLRFGVGEIEAVTPAPGEDTELAAEEARLGHADTLRVAAEARPVGAVRRRRPARRARAPWRPPAPRSRASATTTRRPPSSPTGSPSSATSWPTWRPTSRRTPPRWRPTRHRLAAVSERRAALTALTRKYGETIDEVLAWQERSAARLLDLDGTDERIETLRAERERLQAELTDVAAELSAARARQPAGWPRP